MSRFRKHPFLNPVFWSEWHSDALIFPYIKVRLRFIFDSYIFSHYQKTIVPGRVV